MTIMEWVRSVKPDLIKVQRERGIPALFMAAQMCHESYDGANGLSALAREAQNYAGLKWAEWEREYGCEPVTYGTWEHIEGENVNMDAAFCKCPDWATWLRVYADLLTGRYYKGALKYAADPMLYAVHVWQAGWATDPAYLAGIAGWMSRLYEDYADTIPLAPYTLTPIKSEGGRLLTVGFLGPDGSTYTRLRPLGEALGQNVGWDQQQGAAVLGYPGQKK